MKRLVRLLAIALLGLIVSLALQSPTYSRGNRQQAIGNRLINWLDIQLVASSFSPTTNGSEVLTSNEKIALTSLQTGKQYYDAGQLSAAVQALQEAAKLSENAGDKIQQAQALSFASLALQKLGQWQAAEAAIDSSWSILQSLPSSDRLVSIRAQVLNAKGHLELAKGNTETALATWQDAQALYTQASDRVGKLGTQIDIALAMQSLGLYRRAEKLLSGIEKNIDELPDYSLKSNGLQNFGNLLRQQGNLDRSQKILELSLAIARQGNLSQQESTALLSLANTELAQARRAKDLKDKQKAQQYSKDALAHYQAAEAIAVSPLAKVQAQLNQLTLAIETNQFASVNALLPSIDTLLSQLPASRASVYASTNYAQSLIKDKRQQATGNRERRIEDIALILTRAIEQAKSLEDLRAESYALGILGELYEKQQDWRSAKDYTQSALLIAQSINAFDIAYQWQWQMGRIAKAQQANTEAINYYTQAVKLLEDLRSDLIVLNPDVQFSFRDSVEPVYRQLVDLLLRSPRQGKVSQTNLIQARNLIESLQLAELNNFFREPCLVAKQEIDRVVDTAQPDTAIVYPTILPDRLEIMLKLPQKPLLQYTSYIPQADLEKLLEELRSDLTKPYTLRQVQSLSKQLYDRLLQPFAAELNHDRVKTLVFVLDGSLRNIPMSVLYDGQQYLIQKYNIALAPGLQLIEPLPLNREPLTALVAGLSKARQGFASLQYVDREVEQIQASVSSTVIRDREFTESNLKNKIQETPFPIVHLATHGQFSSNLEDTFILTWDRSIKVNEFNNLLRRDEQSRSDAIELLVLSACQTAAGDKRATLGLAGISVRAGVRSTLASLWNLDDESSALLISQFYQELVGKKVTKAEALGKAQLNLLQNPRYQHPRYWAPYVLLGNWL
jgi:CHAT domain-containing protein